MEGLRGGASTPTPLALTSHCVPAKHTITLSYRTYNAGTATYDTDEPTPIHLHNSGDTYRLHNV